MKGRMNFKMFTKRGSDRKVAINDALVLYAEEDKDRTVAWMCAGGSRDLVSVELKEDFDIVFSRLNTSQSSVVRTGRVKKYDRKVVTGFGEKASKSNESAK